MAANNRAGIGAFITCRCPKCGEGKVFTNSVFSVGHFSDTYDECPKCGLSYEPETGFFFGAMYWSYALITGTILSGAIILNLLGLWDYAILGIMAFLLINIPIIIRYSRMLMLYVVYPLMYKEKFFGVLEGESEEEE